MLQLQAVSGVAVAAHVLNGITAIRTLCTAVCPSHRFTKLTQMSQILVDVEQRMIKVRTALVTPHRQIPEAQHKRMHLLPAMLRHMLIDIATAADGLAT